jgi:hypothetical protein
LRAFGVWGSKSSSLVIKNVGPFPIPNKVDNLAYELKLPSSMKMQPVVSVIYLKQAKEDNCERETTVAAPGFVIVDDRPCYAPGSYKVGT